MGDDRRSQSVGGLPTVLATEIETWVEGNRPRLGEVMLEIGAVDPDDLSMLEDLVRAAWQDAHDQVAQLQAEADPLGGLGGAGGLGNLFKPDLGAGEHAIGKFAEHG